MNVEGYFPPQNTSDMHVFVILMTCRYFDKYEDAIFGTLSVYNQALFAEGDMNVGILVAWFHLLILVLETDNTVSKNKKYLHFR